MNNKAARHFIPLFKRSQISFDDVIDSAKAHIKTLSENKRISLKKSLENGLALLTTKEELDMYLVSYGDIHRQKLQIAYENIPYKVWNEGEISVIDYGCGQCIAEMVLSDFMKKHCINSYQITDFIAIEPSKPSLYQGIRYLKHFYDEPEIAAYSINAGELTDDIIRPKSGTVIHIFSNVLDIDDFEREKVAVILNKSTNYNNILVCVSPFYKEDGRGALMDDFGKMLHGMRCEYKFDKHTDEWDRPFSCQIRIFISAYF